MKLLLDENLSRRIIPTIIGAYPESTQVAFQVALLAMDAYADEVLWAFARDNGYILVTKDSDFNDLSTLYGYPPKVIWLKCGNQPKQRITEILLAIQNEVQAFVNHPDLACLEVY